MNILYVSDSTTLSGAEIVLLGYLDRRAPPDRRARVYLHRLNRRLADALDERGVPYLATEHYSRILLETRTHPLVLAHYALSFSRVAREIRRVIRAEAVDLVHAISYPASLYAALACRWCRVPQIWHEHNIKRLHRVNRRLYRFAAGSCHAVIGPSDAVTTNLARAGIPRRKLRTVYNGIDLRRFDVGDTDAAAVRSELGIPPDAPAIGLFGQMLPYKGHRTLIEAAPAVLRDFPAARFCFVGALENPPYQEELRGLIAGAGLGRAFLFTGWRPDVPAVLRAMDLVTVLTTTPEPAALGLMEAMAAGRPVVATRTGGTPEIVRDGETGVIVEPGNAGAVAGSIVSLLLNPARMRRLGTAGRGRVEDRFTLDRHLAEMEQIYREARRTGRGTESSRAAP
ncbi:MAG TPA: glycosyltransferase family 4 protein [Vicinamibacterales bacterium]|nr:glycosyltransferase family 4 protein [Vicinamibacterales bacterium]